MIFKLKICAYFAVTSSFPIKLFQTCSPFSCLSVSDCNPEGIFANCLLFYRIFVSMLRAIQALSFNVLCFTNNLYKCWSLVLFLACKCKYVSGCMKMAAFVSSSCLCKTCAPTRPSKYFCNIFKKGIFSIFCISKNSLGRQSKI